MKSGATDFLLKPFSLDHLMTVVAQGAGSARLRDENRQLKEELGRRYEFDNIIGRSAPMQEIFATIMRVAPTRATVLLAGESGVGKDLIARAIHFHSPRRDRPFVKINCTALPENLLESELFGYEKGAFTGANATQAGQVRAGRHAARCSWTRSATCPPAIQVKLLRVLQEREFERLGSNETRHIDVRVIAATNQDLRAALRARHLPRGSLLPAERGPDQYSAAARAQGGHPVSGRALRSQAGAGYGQPRRSRSPTPRMDKLLAYHWPGNVRELENVIERSLVMATGTKLERRISGWTRRHVLARRRRTSIRSCPRG